MPRRTRAQELEDESRRAFADALGAGLLFRDEQPDFGLDGDVEHFDPEGRATGLRFFVQLKATDQEYGADALKHWFPLEMADLYRSMALPVLVVRFVADGRRLFARWFHQFDPYEGGLAEKGLTFRWSPEDAWTSATPERLAAEARAFLDLRSATLDLPFRVSVSPGQRIGSVGSAELAIALRDAARRRADVLDVVHEEPRPDSGRVEVGNEHIRVSLSTVAAATRHFDADLAAGATSELIVPDVLVLAALAFERIGQDDLASRLTSSFLTSASLARNAEPVMALAFSMSRAGRIREALELAEELDGTGDSDLREAGFWFTLPARLHNQTLSGPEVEAYVATANARIARRRSEGRLAEAGREALNLANHYRGRDDFAAALPLYEDALRDDPEYAMRPHFWHERAGALFGNERYTESVKAYARALDLGAEERVRPLLADALMFAGEYRQAIVEFEKYAALELGHEAEWRLKALFLRHLIDELGVERQDRNREAADELVGHISPNESPDAIDDRISRALTRDALCGVAWFNRGVWHTDRREWLEASFAYTFCALCQPWDLEAWTNAIVLGLREFDAHAGVDVVHTAQRFIGTTTLLAELRNWVDSQGPDFDRDTFFEALQEVLAAVPTDERMGYVVRLLGPEGRVDTVEIDDRRP